MYFLCRVAFISFMFRGRQSVYFAASDTTRHSSLFMLLQQNLMQPCVRGSRSHRKVTYDVCPSVSVPVCPSVCLCTSSFPPKTSLFSAIRPQTSHIRRMGLRWYFCSGFFRTWDPKRGNESLESSQTLHKDRTNLVAFWIPNCTTERPSLGAYHLSCNQENYPPIMEPERSIVCE